MKSSISIKKDQDGFYTAKYYAFKGCHSQGRTKAEAIAGFITSMKKHGEC